MNLLSNVTKEKKKVCKKGYQLSNISKIKTKKGPVLKKEI